MKPTLTLSDLFWLVLMVAGIGVMWVLQPKLALAKTAQVIASLVLLLIGLAMQAIYVRFRRRQDAEFVGMWKVPGGVWIIAAIVAFVLCYLGYVVTRDPL